MITKYNKIIVSLTAIISIATIDIMALVQGINGVLMMSSIAIIGGIAGYGIAKKKEIEPPA